MTFLSAMRSIEAANRRELRNRERQARLQERHRKLQARINEIEFARLEVEEFDEKVERLTSIHREEPTSLEWNAILTAPPIQVPARLSTSENAARRKLETYKPLLFDRLFRQVEKKRAAMEAEIVAARAKDDESHVKEMARYQDKCKEDAERRELASAILAGSLFAYRDATEFLNPLGEILAAGCDAEVTFPNRFTVLVNLTVESDTVVPSTAKTLTKTGKLSEREMPKGRFNELYQDYVCGSALRTAREFLAFLPVRMVVVHVSTHLMDPSTGYRMPTTVLSVVMPRETIQRINFSEVDASDSMKQFIHRMGFKKSLGFVGVAALEPHEYPDGAVVAVD